MADGDIIVMPKLGLTMTEALLAEWKVAPGVAFRAGDILFTVETDKIVNEVDAEADGRIAEILVPAGEVVAVGTPLARLGQPGRQAAQAPAAPASGKETGAKEIGGKEITQPQERRIIATPLARRLARQHGIDLATISGSGPRGRIKAADVTARPMPDTRSDGTLPQPAMAAAAGMVETQAGRIKLDMTQATIARRLQGAKRDVPHYYLTQQVDLGRLLKLKSELDTFDAAHRTTMTHWILAAVGRALVDQPAADRVWGDGDLIRVETSDVGLAVTGERGLYVPVLRGVGRRSLPEIAGAAKALVEKARLGRLAATDSVGGSISISNLGMFGVTSFLPIINPGQAMILGVGALQSWFRPDAEGRPMLMQEATLALSADHRVINGAEAADFLGKVIAYLQEPMRLVLPPAGGPSS